MLPTGAVSPMRCLLWSSWWNIEIVVKCSLRVVGAALGGSATLLHRLESLPELSLSTWKSHERGASICLLGSKCHSCLSFTLDKHLAGKKERATGNNREWRF